MVYFHGHRAAAAPGGLPRAADVARRGRSRRSRHAGVGRVMRGLCHAATAGVAVGYAAATAVAVGRLFGVAVLKAFAPPWTFCLKFGPLSSHPPSSSLASDSVWGISLAARGALGAVWPAPGAWAAPGVSRPMALLLAARGLRALPRGRRLVCAGPHSGRVRTLSQPPARNTRAARRTHEVGTNECAFGLVGWVCAL